MNRRCFLKSLTWTAAAAALGRLPRALGAATPKPNIIVILVDDMGWADVACNGYNSYYETPHIDRLAAEGMRFTDGYAACAVCSPTRAALLTGRYPTRHGITDWIRPSEATENPTGYEGSDLLSVPKNHVFMEPQEVTVAEALKPAGYLSGHVGKWHVGGSAFYPESQGFDFNAGGCSWGHPFNGYTDPYSIPTLADRQPGEYLTDRESDEAVGFIQSAVDQGRPFFLYMAHYAVHTPIQAKSDLIAYYQGKPIPANRQYNAKYAAMVHSVDEAVGALLDKVRQLGIDDNTVIIFTSDNGGLRTSSATDNYPLRSGKGYPYEGGIREPFIVRWPGVAAAGSLCRTPVISVDILPTACEIASVPLPADRAIDGESLIPLLTQSGELGPRALFWHFPHYRQGRAVTPYSIVRHGPWKLIKWYEGNRFELYNLADDLSEKNDLSDLMPRRVRMLDEMLDVWLRETGGKRPILNRDHPTYQEKNEVRLG